MRTEKARIRKKGLGDRKNVIGRRLRSWLIKRRLFSTEEWKRAKTVMLYVSVGSEVRTGRIINAALDKGKTVLLPVTGKDRLKAVVLTDTKNLKKGRYGIPEPTEGKEFPKKGIDLLVVPGVCFDARGNRIGYGGGYYDRFLRGIKKPTIGLAYENQLVERLPCEPHDQKVKKIVTEKRMIECEK